jgi:hypothetical protein
VTVISGLPVPVLGALDVVVGLVVVGTVVVGAVGEAVVVEGLATITA